MTYVHIHLQLSFTYVFMDRNVQSYLDDRQPTLTLNKYISLSSYSKSLLCYYASRFLFMPRILNELFVYDRFLANFRHKPEPIFQSNIQKNTKKLFTPIATLVR